MRYLLMIYMDEGEWSKLTREKQNAVHRECTTWHEELVKSGHSRGAMGLQPPATATTLRQRDGQIIVTDGPFAETREILGGFEILECRNLDEALAIAKRMPSLKWGLSLELRPCVVGNC